LALVDVAGTEDERGGSSSGRYTSFSSSASTWRDGRWPVEPEATVAVGAVAGGDGDGSVWESAAVVAAAGAEATSDEEEEGVGTVGSGREGAEWMRVVEGEASGEPMGVTNACEA